jgi:hypothetical protein
MDDFEYGKVKVGNLSTLILAFRCNARLGKKKKSGSKVYFRDCATSSDCSRRIRLHQAHLKLKALTSLLDPCCGGAVQKKRAQTGFCTSSRVA